MLKIFSTNINIKKNFNKIKILTTNKKIKSRRYTKLKNNYQKFIVKYIKQMRCLNFLVPYKIKKYYLKKIN